MEEKMDRRTLLKNILVVTIPAQAFAPALASDWKLLGEAQLRLAAGSVSVPVSRIASELSAIKIRVTGKGLWIAEAIVHSRPKMGFKNPVNRRIAARGGETHDLIFPRRLSYLRSIEIAYTDLPVGRDAALIHVFGKA
jgi:hypothetical protein